MNKAMLTARTVPTLLLALVLAGCTESGPQTGPDAATWPEGMSTPIPGATFSLAARHQPGAPREYRNGHHQGFDFVNGTAGRPLSGQEPVVAVADGEILRIDQDYADPSRETLEYWAGLAASPGFTGDYALDQLRGCQVWIRHESGHVSRYAHLSAVHPELSPGDQVEQGQAVGQTGTSGRPPTADEQEPAAHLHFGLWSPAGNRHLCQETEPLACHRQLRGIFGEDALPRHAREVLAAVDDGEAAPETWPPEPLPDTGFSVTPPETVTAGSAFSVPATWEGDAFRPEDFYGILEGHPMGLIDAGDGAWLIGAVPMDFDGEQASLVAGAADAYGQSLAGSRAIAIRSREAGPAPREVPAEVLDLHIEANDQAEREALTRAAFQALPQNEARWQATFRPPLEGNVIHRFGQEIYHGMLRPAYPLPGVAIAAEDGAEVGAANAGRVAFAGELPVRGNTVVLDHGSGVTSVYAHLEEITVSPDESVDRGQSLGRAGRTGAAPGAQVRWEMHVAGIPTDPLDWLDQTLPNRQEPSSG